jgi:hypothetical protein
MAGVDASTVSRMEGCGSQKATSRNLDAVLDALRRAGVEIEEDGSLSASLVTNHEQARKLIEQLRRLCA